MAFKVLSKQDKELVNHISMRLVPFFLFDPFEGSEIKDILRA